jgi:hypothetical protein
MLAYAIEEYQNWRTHRLRKDLLGCCGIVAVAAAIGQFQPLALYLAAMALSIGLGWAEGNHYQPSMSARRIIVTFPSSTLSIVAGKTAASLAAWLLILLSISPVLLLASIVWGYPIQAFSLCALAWLCAFVAALGAGFLSSIVFSKSEGLPGLFALALWLTPSLFLPSTAFANPFAQVWQISKGEAEGRSLLGMAVTLLGGAGILALAGLALEGERRRARA